MGELARQRISNPSAPRTLSGGVAFGDPSAAVKVLETTAQVNFAKVGALTDPLDDFYGAVGRAVLKAAAFGSIEQKGTGLRVTIDRLGVYLRDTYDYNGKQWLGLWSESGVDKSQLAEALGMYLGGYPSIHIDPAAGSDPKTEYAVGNKDFRAYRVKYGRGGDFINVSDVRMVRLPQPTVFNL